MIARRDVLKSLGLAAVAGAAPGLTLAKTGGDANFVLLLLRGAVDGLALAAPYGDGNYRRLRGELAIPAPGQSGGLLKLDGMFGLHPSLRNVHAHFSAGEAIVLHAIASPYRERSHFDGQDLLENGAAEVGAARDGWLNRALLRLGDGDRAIALAQNTPLVLRGDKPTASWAPSTLPDVGDGTLQRLQNLYAGDDFFATRLRQALRSQDIAGAMADSSNDRRRGDDARQFAELMRSAARFLTSPDGPSIAVAELGGWDTHANQGSTSGSLANRFGALDTGLGNLRQELGRAWERTVVAIVTEFGRTVRVNGTRGTDHGTATAALLLGGAVNGGTIVADWPGLAANDLHAGRDLKPTADLRSLFKAVLEEHLDLAPAIIEQQVFPDSAAARPLRNLINS